MKNKFNVLLLLVSVFGFTDSFAQNKERAVLLPNSTKISYERYHFKPIRSGSIDHEAIIAPKRETDIGNESQRLTAVFDIAKNIEFNETSLGGIEQADNSIAISGGFSSSNIIVTVKNSSIAYYDINGNQLFQSPLKYLIPGSPLNYSYFDPKIVYDPLYDRYVVSYLAWKTTNIEETMLFVLVSKTNNPTGGWYYYMLDENSIFGSQPISDSLSIDRPDLAVSNDEVYLNYRAFYGNTFINSESIVINKSDLYAGTSSPQLVRLVIYDPALATPQGNNLDGLLPISHGQDSYGPGLYFVRTKPNQGDSVWVYQTDTLAHATSLGVYKSVYPTSNYVAPPDLPQKNTTQTITAGTARVLDGFLLNGIIHFTYPKRFVSTSSQISYNRLDLFASVLDEKIYNNPNYGCTYPSIASFALANNDPSVVMGFSTTGTNSYVSYRAVGCDHLMDWSNELTIVEGDTIHPGQRWGDYTGAARERETLQEICWVFGNYSTYDTIFSEIMHKSYVAEIRRAAPNVIYPNVPNTYKIEVFPNPASQELNIRFGEIPKTEVHIILTDLMGKEIFNIWDSKLINDKISTSLPNLAKGMYFIQIHEKNKLLKYEKIIID